MANHVKTKHNGLKLKDYFEKHVKKDQLNEVIRPEVEDYFDGCEYTCDICLKVFTNRRLIMKHAADVHSNHNGPRMTHEEKISCNLCKIEVTRDSAIFLAHLVRFHKVRPEICCLPVY